MPAMRSSYLLLELWALDADGNDVSPLATVEGITLMARRAAVPSVRGEAHRVP